MIGIERIKKHQILGQDKINMILGQVPQKMLHYYKAQQEGALISSMTMFDRSVTKVHPVTKKMDGKLRVREFVGDDVWSIFPQHVKGRLIEEALSDCVFLRNNDLRLDDKALDETYYLKSVGKFCPLKGWLHYRQRENTPGTGYLKSDHIHLYLAMMTRDCDFRVWETCAIVP